MILSDREIKLALRRGHLRITPLPSDKAIASTSVDLTLHEEISSWTPRPERTGAAVTVYPARAEFDVVRLATSTIRHLRRNVHLHPTALRPI